MTALIAAHPLLAVTGALAILTVLALGVVLALTAEPSGGRNASRPARRSPSKTWAREQRARAGKARAIFPLARALALATTGWGLHTAGRAWRAARTWWAFHRPRRDPTTEEREAMALFDAMRLEDTGGLTAIHHEEEVRVCSSEQVTWRDSDPLGPSDCGEETRAATRQALGAFLPAPTNSPAAATTPLVAAGHPDVPGQGAIAADIPSPAGDLQPGSASLEPGPEGAEPSAAPVPAPVPDGFGATYAYVRAIQELTTEDYLASLARPWAEDTGAFLAVTTGWS